MKRSTVTAAIISALLAVPTAARGQATIRLAISSVKFTPTMTTANGTTSNSSIDLFAARNEFEAFQVVVEAGATPLNLVHVEWGNLELLEPTGTTNPNIFIPSENLRIYRIAPVEITQKSNYESPGPGLYPDPLIPHFDSEKGPALFWNGTDWIEQPWSSENRESEIDISAQSRQIWWAEVLVPRTQEIGNYRGTLKVLSSQMTKTFTINLEVVPIPALSSTSTLPTLFLMGPDELCRAHGDATDGFCTNYWRWSELYGRFLLDHRITAQLPSPETANPLSSQANARYTDAYRNLLIGTDSDSRLKGASATAIDYPWWVDEQPNSPLVQNVDRFKTWQNLLASDFSNQYARTVEYDDQADEPSGSNNPNGWYFVKRQAEVSMAAAVTTGHPRVPNLVTASIRDYTLNHSIQSDYINIITPVLDQMDHPSASSPYFGNQRANYVSFEGISPTNRTWGYQSCDQHACGSPGNFNDWPNFMIDATGVQNRAEPWLHFIYNLEGMLYYSVALKLTTAWQKDGQWEATGNGDGTLLYPGTPLTIGGNSHIPVASYRLKMIREGMEDYEYLQMCAQLDATRARNIALTLFPHTNINSGAMYNANNYVSQQSARDPLSLAKLLETQRRELVNCITSGTLKTSEWADSYYQSPPTVVGPIRACSGGTPSVEAVTVDGVIKNTAVELYREDPNPNSTPILLDTETAASDGVLIFNVPVSVGDKIFAIGAPSGGRSNVVEVKSYSGVSPVPKLIRPTYYECELWTLGGNLVANRPATVRQGITTLATVTPSSNMTHGFEYVSGLVAGTDITMEQSVCGFTPGAVSFPVITYAQPPLPAPSLGDCEVYGKPETCIQASGLEPGATLTLTTQTSPSQTFQRSIFSETEQVFLSVPAGTKIEVYQQLCSSHQVERRSHTPTNHPCSEMPAPRIEAPFEGQAWVRVIERVAGSRIQVFAGDTSAPIEELGDSTLDHIKLKRTVRRSDILWVFQSTAQCTGESSFLVSPIARGE